MGISTGKTPSEGFLLPLRSSVSLFPSPFFRAFSRALIFASVLSSLPGQRDSSRDAENSPNVSVREFGDRTVRSGLVSRYARITWNPRLLNPDLLLFQIDPKVAFPRRTHPKVRRSICDTDVSDPLPPLLGLDFPAASCASLVMMIVRLFMNP